MKTITTICTTALLLAQALLAQTTWKEDWRTYSIEEIIKFHRHGGRGGWTDAKILEVFGKPDENVPIEDFREREAPMSYKLSSGLSFQIVKSQDKRYGNMYFATFQVIDPEVDKDTALKWTVNVSRPLTDAEKEEFHAIIQKTRTAAPKQQGLPPTDTPPSKLDNKTSYNK
jgi:hypothetical protein